MKRCPPEICAKISKSHASTPVKYQSVLVRGLHQTLTLASLLENAPPNQRRVCDLPISSDLRYSTADKKIESAMAAALMWILFFLRSFYTGNRSGRGWREVKAKRLEGSSRKRQQTLPSVS